MAAELTQEAFIRFMGYQTGDTVHNVRAMLYRIAGNLATDFHRVQMKRPVQTDIDALPQHELPISDASDPARIVYARQMLEALCHVIEALPPQCYRAFVLHKFDGLSDISRKDAESVTAWRKSRLIFRDTPLEGCPSDQPLPFPPGQTRRAAIRQTESQSAASSMQPTATD